MPIPLRAFSLGLSLTFSLTAVAGDVVAQTSASAPSQDREQEAANAYDRGVAAHARGDFAAAADHFARADELAPNPVALEAALRAVVLADLPELGMSLVERAESRRPLAPKIAAAVGDAAERFASRVPKASPTTTEPPSAVRRAPPPPPPPPEESEASEASKGTDGISPAFFWMGVAATAVLGTFTIASGVDVLDRADAFEAAPSRSAADGGQAAETRTYVLGAATGVVGLGTIAVGSFAVAW